jgi:hypothetical protein
MEIGPIRFHHVRACGRSAAHAEWALQGGEDDDTYAMEGGRALHGLLLKDERVLCFDSQRRGKAWEAFEAENPGAHILSPKGYEKTMGMADAVASHRDARQLLEGIREQTLLFDFLGQRCQSTPDVRTRDRLVELKSTNDASLWGFRRQIEHRHYHAQMAFQREAVVTLGHGQPDAYIVAVESTEPHVVTLFRLSTRTIEYGARLVRLWMERLVGCIAAGTWPGYSQTIVDVDFGPPGEDVELDYTGVETA